MKNAPATPLPWNVGDAVVWLRSRSSWSRISVDRVQAEVIGVTKNRIRIRLRSNIINSLTALVDPARLIRDLGEL